MMIQNYTIITVNTASKASQSSINPVFHCDRQISIVHEMIFLRVTLHLLKEQTDDTTHNPLLLKRA